MFRFQLAFALGKFEHEISEQLTMQDLIDYRAFLELQQTGFVLNPEAEKKKKIKEQLKRMIEIDKQQATMKKKGRNKWEKR